MPCPELRPGSRCGQTVKALSGGRSNGQAVCWGTIYGTTGDHARGVADPFAHAQLISGQGQKSGVVKRSRPFFDGQKS